VIADDRFQRIGDTLRVVASALDRAGVPFALGGSMACWVSGGPAPTKDLDLAIAPEDAETALGVLADAGLRVQRPPEDWLLKAWHDEVCVDLIFEPLGVTVTREFIAEAPRLGVLGMRTHVMRLEDVFASKLLAMNEHYLDFEYLLTIARPIRERVDWTEVRARSATSPYAKSFLTLLEELGLIDRARPD
jgi:predicted nucleotidyltransferase